MYFVYSTLLMVIKVRNRIQDLRIDSDLRQADIAKAIGITQRKYSYIETGTQQVTDEILIKLSNYYKTSTDYILGLTDIKEPYPRKYKINLSNEGEVNE